MNLTTVPGYTDLFGPAPKTYGQFLENIPATLVLPVLIGINAEMYASLSDDENQRRVRNIFSDNFTVEQAARMNNAYARYKRIVNPAYNDEVFGNRYLVHMCIRELNCNRTADKTVLTQEDEFNILQAYLLVVQEINDSDKECYDKLRQAPMDKDHDYRLIWTGLINKFEFTDIPHPAYSLYRLLQFCLYAAGAFPVRFKEYLSQFHFTTPLEFIGSFTTLAHAAVQEHPEKAFKKVTFIQPHAATDEMHLKEMDISPMLASGKEFTLDDIRSYPLYRMENNKYLLIDQQFFLKKIYVGPFFELIKKTGLNKDLGKNDQESFNAYSGLVSDNVLEKRCFSEIVSRLSSNKHDVVHFDDGSPNCPDGYYRSGKTILLIEFKGYIFPAKLSDKPDFIKLKNYLNDRFIEKPGGAAKGVGQLIRQIELLAAGAFNFDQKFNNGIGNKHYTIYPIICHTDYYFSLPGVSDYLNNEFNDRKGCLTLPDTVVKDLVLIDLVHLFEMMSYGKNFSDVVAFIDAYQRRMPARKKLQAKEPGVANFLRSYAGFDEMYRSHFSNEVRGGELVKKYITDLIVTNEQILSQPLP